MIRASLSVLFLAAVALAPIDRAGAQVADQPSVTTNASQNDVLSTKQAGITRHALQQHTWRADTKATATAAVTQTRSRRGTTLMIVGGAAFLAGLIIGDDAGTALAIGGAVVGLYGLYLWAQ